MQRGYRYGVYLSTVFLKTDFVVGDLALPGSERIQVDVVGGSVFSLLVLVLLAHLGGWAGSLMGAPPLLGMLLAGILLKNIPHIGTSLG